MTQGNAPSNMNGLSKHVARPLLNSHHSNSVPSTPYQQARDLRFHSRSPSPNRGLANRSPSSVVSEVVGQPVQPVVCKFETGAEIKRRRIPYVDYGDDGQQGLAAPKKEPKKCLEPDEREKLSGDMRELYDRLLPSDESEERRALLVKKLDRILNEEWPGNDIRVNVFGSSGNLLSSSDSDVDICVTTPLKRLESMHSLATLLHRHGMEKVVCRASAKVPIVKCWDPELRLAIDLNVNNPLALDNTRMIKTYVQLDERVRPLAKIIKYWTKRRILNDAAFGGTISSYTWICMVISFLQRRDPPVLPSLQKVKGKRRHWSGSETPEFADDLEALQGCGNANKKTLADLLFHFFRDYGHEFDYSKYVVSVKEGRLLTRKEKRWDPTTNYHDKEARARLCVEEPFTVVRNLGNSADDYAWNGIHREIRRAFDLLADGQRLDECCEQYEFPIEEKPTFRKPGPRPTVVLRRSASQSGRQPNHEPAPGRQRQKNGRNQSAQRTGNRRASSGTTYGNGRMPYQPQSPQALPVQNPVDFFMPKGALQDQLAQQIQYLQAKQMALDQLAQQQLQGPQRRMSELSGSPHHRGAPVFTNGVANGGLASPRYLDPPQSAPLLPGYLYHYPARYPQAQPMGQPRPRAGTNTNPSSPSLLNTGPPFTRQYRAGPVADGSSSSHRSQSQPGRSGQHPLALQQQTHPGFDVSGAIPGPHYMNNLPRNQVYIPGHGVFQLGPVAPGAGGHLLNLSHPIDNSISATPKEYMGYYVGQSPSLGPVQLNGQSQAQIQYATMQQHMGMPPAMSLRDPPSRQRRVTPDDLRPPVVANGRRGSRSPSPSPLSGHLRSYSTTADLRSASQQQSVARGEMPTSQVAYAPIPTASRVDFSGPLIVNGSTPSAPQKATERANGTPAPTQQTVEEPPTRTLPLRTNDSDLQNGSEPFDSTRIAPSPRGRAGSRLAMSPNGITANTLPENFRDMPPLNAPLLSPVAEMRTPSPTQHRIFDKQDSPRSYANGLKGALNLRNENAQLSLLNTKHERKGSVPVAGSGNKTPTMATISSTAAAMQSNANGNPWLQATRKGHKKSKSTNGPVRDESGSGTGQPMPANEADRKGG